jgi:hypothetical protein
MFVGGSLVDSTPFYGTPCWRQSCCAVEGSLVTPFLYLFDQVVLTTNVDGWDMLFPFGSLLEYLRVVLADVTDGFCLHTLYLPFGC